MIEEEGCNTTLGLGIGSRVVTQKNKQLKNKKRGFWLDLSLPIHPNIEANDHDHHKNDGEKDDHDDSFSSKGIDDDEDDERMNKSIISNACNSSDESRKKLKFTTEQTTLLEASFNTRSTLNTGQKQELAKRLNLLPRQIEVWFQNRRARTKLKQIEQEYELLKKCCETLNEENYRLKKELQKARCCSLKLDHHHHQLAAQPLSFYIRYPTTTMVAGEDKKTVAAVNAAS